MKQCSVSQKRPKWTGNVFWSNTPKFQNGPKHAMENAVQLTWAEMDREVSVWTPQVSLTTRTWPELCSNTPKLAWCGTKMAPKWPEIGQKRPENGPKSTQSAANTRNWLRTGGMTGMLGVCALRAFPPFVCLSLLWVLIVFLSQFQLLFLNQTAYQSGGFTPIGKQIWNLLCRIW